MEQSKVCICCGIEQDRSKFPKQHGRVCRSCRNIKQRENRKRSGDLSTKLYEKTKNGYLMRAYRNMLSRVTGVQSKNAHLYEGLEILSKEEFYSWSINDPTFNELFVEYENSNYENRLAPSVDRKDSTLGYNLANMRWLPHWKNSQLGALCRHSKQTA